MNTLLTNPSNTVYTNCVIKTNLITELTLPMIIYLNLCNNWTFRFARTRPKSKKHNIVVIRGWYVFKLIISIPVYPVRSTHAISCVIWPNEFKVSRWLEKERLGNSYCRQWSLTPAGFVLHQKQHTCNTHGMTTSWSSEQKASFLKMEYEPEATIGDTGWCVPQNWCSSSVTPRRCAWDKPY